MKRRTSNFRPRRWTVRLAGCIIVSFPAAGLAQTTGKTGSATSASTLSGVFTDEQASRGKDVYAGACKSCHTPASHTGATFAKWWRGKQLSDLFGFISTKMPKNDPGSLSPEDAADVVAYLLKMNAMPVGHAELPPDMDSLSHVRIAIQRGRTVNSASTATTSTKRKKP